MLVAWVVFDVRGKQKRADSGVTWFTSTARVVADA